LGSGVTWPLSQGQVIQADLGLREPKLFVVVSNDRRNRQLRQVLAARLTTSPKPDIPSVVQLAHHEAFNGYVVCDDIVEVYRDEVVSVAGALLPRAVHEVNAGLAAALGLLD
jgi:mRNA interferase MazF